MTYMKTEVRKSIEIDQDEFLRGLNKMIIEKTMFGAPDRVNTDNYEDTEMIIAIYKDKGMENTKQMLYGDPAVVLTALCSTFQTFLSKGLLPDPKIEKDIKKLLYDVTGEEVES